LKKRVYEFLEKAKEGDTAGLIFDWFIMTLISLNVLAVTLATVQSISFRYNKLFNIFEFISVMIFTVEYIFRMWSCTVNEKFKHPLFGRIKYFFTPFAIVDLLAILPFYLPRLIPVDLRFLRALRLIRLFRVLKMARYNAALSTLKNVIVKTREELIVTVFTVFIFLILLSSAVYLVENPVQPEAFPDIPTAMWWGVMTMTTVGYGNIYPITVIGRFFAAIVSVLGIGLFALPAGFLASGFEEEMQNRKRKKKIICPKCGEEIKLE
jgi:voltage-gated potassium channel